MYKRILVPTDGSSTAQKGLIEACGLAKALNAAVEILYVVDSRIVYTDFSGVGNYGDLIDALISAGESILADAKADAAKLGVEATTKLLETTTAAVAEVILKEETDWNADLVVMGTHGRRGLRHVVMGSDAESVVHGSSAPVLLVRFSG